MKRTAIMAAAMFLASSMTADAKEIVDVPPEVADISEELGAEYGICPELIQAICFKESRFQPDIESGGCAGIMQVSPRWHSDRMDRLGVTDIYDTYGNMLVAVDYLSELEKQYEDIGIVLMVYNGDSSVREVLDGKADISDYAAETLVISAELEREHGK